MKSNTLLIRHLPPYLSDEEKRELLQHFGVVQLKTLAGQVKKSNVVFARFESDSAASIALHRLHQMDVLGHPLTVEFARGPTAHSGLPTAASEPTCLSAKEEADEGRKQLEAFLGRLNAWNAPLDLCRPPPPTLKYQYPPPSRQVLINITHSLAAVPKFYTQVLHLMNRMHLPSPFQAPEVCQEEEGVEEMEQESVEEEESEMESEGEGQRTYDVIPLKRTRPQAKRPLKRRRFPKPEKSSGLTTARPSKPDQVFEMMAPAEPTLRRIQLRLPVPGPTAGVVAVEGEGEEVAGGFGLMFPPSGDQMEQPGEGGAQEREDPEAGSVITAEQLVANRIPERDRKHLSVFNKYEAGMPSCRLYVKNLSRHVTERDLHFIFRRFLAPHTQADQPSMFDIRLMQEGRMKGQAFVTLQNTKQAQIALTETNGFILQDKPMVVQFARSAKAK